LNFEDNFFKNINIEEPEETVENSCNKTLIDEILDEEDLLNYLKSNDILDKAQTMV